MTSSEELSPTKQALIALQQMQKKLDAWEKTKYEPIAIIGMGGRFPNAPTLEAFWQLLERGQDGISTVEKSYWQQNLIVEPQLQQALENCKPSQYAGLVPYLCEFDASFFNIAPREAVSIDPQQRLLLEVSWEALENAGIDTEALKGRNVGVFVGICGIDYWHQLLSLKNRPIDAYLTTGNTHSMASGRLSYFYGLTGPSISIDTACSSSLVAVHLAINSLRNQECGLALVGGVNRLISPQITINFAKAGMLANDGRCKTFDATADGFVRSEGCGVLVLKRLSDAIANQDRVLAVLCGSAVNQDGRTVGITVPSSLSQQKVINLALENSRLKPEQINYLETHGTGTFLGDSIEIEALNSIFNSSRDNQEPLILGALKTNIGHLEGAAGIASLIKVILCLQNQQIPPNLHLQIPNPQINWQELPFMLPKTVQPWLREDKPRTAGISSFGFSGTNAHVIMAESPVNEINQSQTSNNNLASENRPNCHLFTLSARTEKALHQLVSAYIEYLEKNPQASIESICFTVKIGRTHFAHRLAIIATSNAELKRKLNQWQTGQQPLNVWQNRVNSRKQNHLAFVFANLNFNWQIINENSLYFTPFWQKNIDKLINQIKKINNNNLALSSEKLVEFQKLKHNFIVAYSLGKLWQTWGTEPNLLIGEGIGQYVVACLSGVFDVETAINLIAIQLANYSEVEKCNLTQQLNYFQPQIKLSLPQGHDLASLNFTDASYWRQENLLLQKFNSLPEALAENPINLKLEFSQLNDWKQILLNLSQLYIIGVKINWLTIDKYYGYQKISLPTYPFQRKKYWLG